MNASQYLIVGAGGGIGAALVARILASEPSLPPEPSSSLATDNAACFVHATWHRRKPELEHPQLRWHQLDVTDDSQIANLASELQADMQQAPLHWLVNCVGVLHHETLQPEKNLRAVKAAAISELIDINCTPSLLLAKHFAPHLKQHKAAVFATVSAKVGSIEDNRLGGWYSYRMSKAALNMALKTLSIEWRRTHPGVCVAALHPGTTATGLSEPFQHNVPSDQLFSSAKTADYLYRLMSNLEPSASGRFWAFDGEELPW